MKINWVILIFVFLASCTNSVEESKTVSPVLPEEAVYKFPTVIDTVDFELLDFLKNDYSNTTWLSTAEYRFLYIGPETDIIYIDHFLSSFTPPPPPPPNSNVKVKEYDIPEHRNKFEDYFIDWLSNKTFKHYSKAKVNVLVDTSSITNNSYPIIIKNLDVDTIQVGYGDYLPLIMEALDSNKKWKPVQEVFFYGCGNGVGTVILPPKQVVLSSAPIFKGNFDTKLRLTVPRTDIHSNTFEGTINYRQFESMFNSKGDYKAAYKAEQKRDS